MTRLIPIQTKESDNGWIVFTNDDGAGRFVERLLVNGQYAAVEGEVEAAAVDFFGGEDTDMRSTADVRVPPAHESVPSDTLVVWSGFGDAENVLLHREDKEACCQSRPTIRPTSALGAVTGKGNRLCDRCDWPENADALVGPK